MTAGSPTPRIAVGVEGSGASPATAEGPFVVYREVGQRGHAATSLLHVGTEARNLDGGYPTWFRS